MIKAACFEKKWIGGFKKQNAYRKINPPLLEKMIQALSLVQHLKVLGLDFIFKGGTSLILLLFRANRFSIDVDIITRASREEIEALLDRVVAQSQFTGWHLDAARSYQTGVPKAHYKIEYPSHYSQAGNHILLDILFEDNYYPEVRELPIKSDWIETETAILVKLPTIDGITGDKLTAFAPTTTGIRYGGGKALEIIKQLFDLGALFDNIEDLTVVAASYTNFIEREIAYRGLSISKEDALWDTIEVCRTIAFRDANKTEEASSRYSELKSGISSLSSHLIGNSFTLDHAITAAAKIAYLAARLLKVDHSPLLRYTEGSDIQQLNIGNPQWNILNKLKKLPDQSAFYYWYQCLDLLDLLKDPRNGGGNSTEASAVS